MSIELVLYLVAFVFFLIAATPAGKHGWAFEWLAFAALVLSLVV